MRKTLMSPSWYRVATVKPRLRAHGQIHRQRFRGQTWYILQDHHTGRFHRVAPAANLMICLMDGRRTMQEIWERVCERFPEDPPTQDETIRLLHQLHASDLLQGEVAPDLVELSHRSATQIRRNLLLRLRNPLALRFPLLDPDRFLGATVPFVRPLFSLAGFIAWLALVVTGITLAVMHWPELTTGLSDRVLSVENIALMLVVYPVIKALHELGHGYATKVWGGEVHEIGIMLLVLMPIPYVDASSSSAFPSKWRRAIVGGAGIMVELLLAALAMIFWVHAEPGLARAAAFNVMLIGGVSTVLFNGNPLLRFDGYYVLTDLIEIPNLGTRSNKFIMHLIQRYIFGMRDHVSPVTEDSERPWFFVYGIAAFIYRLFIALTIAAFVATKLFFIGVLLALWSLGSLFVWPLVKGARFVLTSPQLRGRRTRAVSTTVAAATAITAAVFLVPLPYATVTKGVVPVNERAAVRALARGVVAEVVAVPNTVVDAGDPLIVLEDPILEAEVGVITAQLHELRLRLDAAELFDRVQADVLREQIQHTEASLDLALQRMNDLVIRAPTAGLLAVPEAADLPGRFMRQGTVIAYVIEDNTSLVRVLVSEADVDLVRYRTRKVDVRFPGHLDHVVPALLDQQIPAAVGEIPDPALTTKGGGDYAVDPSDPYQRRPLERLFQFDIAVLEPMPSRTLGGHAFVRFDHGTEAIAWRLYRALRQVFLSRFDV